MGFSLNAKPLVHRGGNIAPEKGPRSKNALTVATHPYNGKAKPFRTASEPAGGDHSIAESNLNRLERVATDSAVLSVGFSLNAKLLVNCDGSIAPEKGPRSKNALTVATHFRKFSGDLRMVRVKSRGGSGTAPELNLRAR